MTEMKSSRLATTLILLLALPMALVTPRLVIYGPQELKDKLEYSGKPQHINHY